MPFCIGPSASWIESVSRTDHHPLPRQRTAPSVPPSSLPVHPAPLLAMMVAGGTTGERAAQLLWVSRRVLSSAGSGVDTWPWATSPLANSTGLCGFWKTVWPGPGRGRGNDQPAWCTAWPPGSTCRPSCRSKVPSRWGSLGWRKQDSRGCLTWSHRLGLLRRDSPQGFLVLLVSCEEKIKQRLGHFITPLREKKMQRNGFCELLKAAMPKCQTSFNTTADSSEDFIYTVIDVIAMTSSIIMYTSNPRT